MEIPRLYKFEVNYWRRGKFQKRVKVAYLAMTKENAIKHMRREADKSKQKYRAWVKVNRYNEWKQVPKLK